MRRAGILLLATVLGAPAAAQSRLFVGARNLGMGGTGVGSSTDALAVYFNPAGMAFGAGFEVEVPLVTAEAEINGDLFNEVDQIDDLFDAKSLDEIQDALNDGTATREDLQTVLQAFLYEVPDLEGETEGAAVRGSAGPAFRYRNWGVSLSLAGNGGADGKVDLTAALALGAAGFAGAIPDPMPAACAGDTVCLDLADQLVAAGGGALDPARAEELVAAAGPALASDPRAQELLIDIVEATAQGGATLADNQSAAITTGILVSQLAFSYSHQVLGDKLAVGGNAKLMRGETYFQVTSVAALEDGEQTLEDILDTENTRSDTQVGLDLGVMYRPWPKVSFGLVGNNLNSPAFELSQDRGEIEFDPLFRVGAAYRPWTWFNIAADLDLNEVDSSVVSDHGHRYANLGVEFLAGRFFQGWLGAYSNLARSETEPSITGGFGFGIGRFTIALAAAVALDDVQVASGEDDQSYPRGAAASLQLGFRPGKNAG